MYEHILNRIPTTVNHQSNKAEFDALCADIFTRHPDQRDALAADRQAMESRLLNALKSCPAVTEYTMMPDEHIVERLSYQALNDAAEGNVQDDDNNRPLFDFADFVDAYREQMNDWTIEILYTEEDPDEVAAQAGEMAYDRCKDDQA